MAKLRRYFRHFRVFNNDKMLPNGGVTLLIESNPRDDGTFLLTISGATCNMKDHFSKAVGRIKAAGKFNSPKQRVTMVTPVPENEINATLKAFAYGFMPHDIIGSYDVRLDIVKRNNPKDIVENTMMDMLLKAGAKE